MKDDVSQSRCPYQARRSLREATETAAGTLREVKASLAQTGTDNNCWPGSSLGERSKEQVSFEKSFPRTGPKAVWRVQTQLEEGFFVWQKCLTTRPDDTLGDSKCCSLPPPQHLLMEPGWGIIKLWRYFSAGGFGKLVKVEGAWKQKHISKSYDDQLAQIACFLQQDNGHKHAAEAPEEWFRDNRVLEPKPGWQCSCCFKSLVVCPWPPSKVVQGRSSGRVRVPGGQECGLAGVRTLLIPAQSSRKIKELKSPDVPAYGDQAASAKDWPAEGEHSRKHLSCSFFLQILAKFLHIVHELMYVHM